jgi:hypothetical protein
MKLVVSCLGIEQQLSQAIVIDSNVLKKVTSLTNEDIIFLDDPTP